MKGRIASLNDIELKLERNSRIVHVYINHEEITELKEPIDFYILFLKKSVDETINSVYGIHPGAIKRKEDLWTMFRKYQFIEPTDENPKYTYKLNADFETLLKEFLVEFY